jgi:hypothetical protein
LRNTVTDGKSVEKGEVLELLVSHLGHHPEYIGLARTVSEQLYEDAVGARSVVAVAVGLCLLDSVLGDQTLLPFPSDIHRMGLVLVDSGPNARGSDVA